MVKIHAEDEKFIPTFEEWGRLYTAWREMMVKSLSKGGSEQDCREAVHEAFLKVMGISDHLKLEEELSPKLEGCWYGFIKSQARGIMSNYHRFTERYVPMKDYASVDDDDSVPVYESDFEKSDREWIRKGVRNALKKVCNEAGVCERNRKVFEMFVLDEIDSDTIVRTLPEIRNANNLYRVKNRIMGILAKSARDSESPFAELMAA